ncbi:uncharacterized protein LOC109723468 isoform X3 [Ananas comosus]|uniref:Uncharacterized protein LOC109723468 isoform X3 n=1 Tax=Ananas comosus TaxID=4615 RepID=A0A6P5GHL6_ANACO|nr:uncharacterized protein LOC109723468 isoform X3 [Ananas comosus]
MGDCAAVPLCAQYQIQRLTFNDNRFIPRNVSIRLLRRNCNLREGQLIYGLKSSKVHVMKIPLPASNGLGSRKEHSLKCHCTWSFMDSEGVVPLNWMLVDQTLLTVSIIFTYMAGVIPQRRNFPSFTSSSRRKYKDAADSTNYGSGSDSWGEVRAKLLEALKAHEQNGDSDDVAIKFENCSKSYPLNMFAINEGPRLRLLWAAFQQLQQEVINISRAGRENWMVIVTDVIKGSIEAIYIKWLEDELRLKIGEPNTKLLTSTIGKLKGDDRILQNFNRSGKGELYSDLLFFLRFGSLRNGCCYDTKFLTENGVIILEDLVIWLADVTASFYLELVSIDGDTPSEISVLGLSLCSLSTRSLQRLRNEVALNRWLQQNFESVVAMFDDRYELYVLSRQQREMPENHKRAIWWKRFAFRNSEAPSVENFVQISPFSLPAKRTKELRALTGWRYYFSLVLEFSDITMPFLRAVCTKISNAVSFFLVCMIGRSVGLIFTGIRQSLGWSS